MSHMYLYCRESGMHWILAFILIALVTVSTCVRQQDMLLHASFSQAELAMK